METQVARMVTTMGRDENIAEMVTFPFNEDEIASWFHVNDLDELRFTDRKAPYLTVPEFNQAMRDAEKWMQEIQDLIDAGVRFLKAKLQDEPEKKGASKIVCLGFEEAAVWEFCMQDKYRPKDRHIELSYSGMLLQVTYLV